MAPVIRTLTDLSGHSLFNFLNDLSEKGKVLVEKAHIKIVAVVVNLSVSCFKKLAPSTLTVGLSKFWVLGCHRPSQEYISAI